MTTVAIASGAAALASLVGGAVMLLFLKRKRRARPLTSTLTVQPGTHMATVPMTVPALPPNVDQGLNDAALELATPLTSTLTVQPGTQMATAPMAAPALPPNVDQGLSQVRLSKE